MFYTDFNKQFTAFQVTTMMHTLYLNTDVSVPDKKLCHSNSIAFIVMANASCELGQVILMSIRVPILLSKYQNP